jgi:hypothetical protein
VGQSGKISNNLPVVGTNIATNQDVRNLNRMYPNGQVPTTSRFSALVQSGGAVYDASIGKWVGPTGYTGVGQSGKISNNLPVVGTNIATNQDVRNLNRLYPNGQVPTTSRFSALVQSGGAVYDASIGKWVGPTGYTGVGQGLKQIPYNQASVDPYAQVVVNQASVDPYAQVVVNQASVDPYAQVAVNQAQVVPYVQTYSDPYAQQASVDPYVQTYSDPYAQQASVDPQTYSDIYAQQASVDPQTYSDPYGQQSLVDPQTYSDLYVQ